MRRLLMVLACTVWGIAPAAAQTCTGGVGFDKAPLQAGGEAAFSSNSRSFFGGVAGGNTTWFWRGAGEVSSFSDIDPKAKGILGSVGAEFPVSAGERTLFVCPIATVARTWGPSIDIDVSAWLLQFGGSVGFVAGKAGQATIVPTATVSFNDVRAHETSQPQFGSFDFTNSTSFGSLQFGAGFLFNDRMSLVPSIIVPFGLDGGETAFAVLFTTKIGS